MRVPATPAGHDQPRDFVRSHGRIRMIGIEGTGSWGAGLARPLGGPPARRPQGSSVPSAPSAAAGEPRIRSEPEPPPAEHRPEADALPVAKTGTGPCEQIRVLLARRRSAMKARARRPPADHRPAGHRPRRRAHPPRTVSAARGLIDALARTRPAPATHRPRIGDRASAAPPGPPPPDPGPTRSPTSTPSCAHQPPAPPRRCSPPRRCAVNHRHPARRRRPTTPAESAPRPPSPPCAAPPRSPPAPGRPTATDSTAAATDRPTGSRTPTPRPPGDPRTKAYAARLTATGKNCKEILRRPRTRHRPRSMAPADPPPTRTPHRRPAPRAPRTRTHPPPKPPTT